MHFILSIITLLFVFSIINCVSEYVFERIAREDRKDLGLQQNDPWKAYEISPTIRKNRRM
jgi:hypothetical protein